MRCKYTKQGANQYYDEHIDDYYEAKANAFLQELMDLIGAPVVNDDVDKDLLQGFLDSFTFKDEGEWLADGYESELGDCIDQAYQEFKERNI